MSEDLREPTPGPWEAGGLTRDRYVLPGGDSEGMFSMGDVNIFPPMGEAGPVAIAAGEANGRLIAAAPDLLAALKRATAILDDIAGREEHYAAATQAHLAIDKAEGTKR